MSYHEVKMRDVRLSIVSILAQTSDGSMNVGMLYRVLDELPAERVARDELEAQIAWLEREKLVTSQRIGGVCLVQITQRGLDTASGQTSVPGVTRPIDKRLGG